MSSTCCSVLGVPRPSTPRNRFLWLVPWSVAAKVWFEHSTLASSLFCFRANLHPSSRSLHLLNPALSLQQKQLPSSHSLLFLIPPSPGSILPKEKPWHFGILLFYPLQIRVPARSKSTSTNTSSARLFTSLVRALNPRPRDTSQKASSHITSLTKVFSDPSDSRHYTSTFSFRKPLSVDKQDVKYTRELLSISIIFQLQSEP